MTNELSNELTIIVVAFNSNELLIECLDNVKEFKVLIVDNGKNEKIFSRLDYQNNNIQIITKNKNLGFPKGINFAVRFVKTNFFLILNADTFISKQSIDNLLKTCKKYENCGAAGGITEISKDGYDLFPENGKNIERNIKQRLISDSLHNLVPSGELCVEVSKIGLMINVKNFIKVGKFSEKFFMFWEEVDLCKKFRNHNLSVIINPQAKIIHNMQKSSNKDLTTFVIKNFHLELSPLIYFKIKKSSGFLYSRLLKYLFRSVSYSCILNLKKSLNNLIKFSAIFYFIVKK